METILRYYIYYYIYIVQVRKFLERIKMKALMRNYINCVSQQCLEIIIRMTILWYYINCPSQECF